MATTKIYGLIGFPLGHSFSKKFFTEKFNRENTNAEYRNFEIDDIDKIRGIFNDDSICGLNVTIPYKQAVIPYLTSLDKGAAAIGSVNVIKPIRNNGTFVTRGYNTDVIGFCESIRPHLNTSHKKALVLAEK